MKLSGIADLAKWGRPVNSSKLGRGRECECFGDRFPPRGGEGERTESRAMT